MAGVCALGGRDDQDDLGPNLIGKSRLHLVRAAMISGGSCSPAWAVRQVRLSREVRSAVTKNPTAITMKMTPRATVTDVV